MQLFGKKPKNGEKEERKRLAQYKKKRLKYKRPSDVQLFYQMPVYLLLGVFLFFAGFAWIQHNAKIHRAQVLASSMTYNEQLPLWGGTSKGNLNLGHTKLSKDGKTLAVEIKYDSDAHTALSSFGNRYKLRLVDTKSNSMKDAKLSYGIFGTDGSGVLTVYSPAGFQNQSFIVMIIDNGQLVTSADLNDQTQMSDDDIDKSITAELSNAQYSNNSTAHNSVINDQDTNKTKLPPLYYVRLNAHNAGRNYRNWSNDSELINDLFVKSNLNALDKKMNQTSLKLKKAKKTLKEMDARLAENKDDKVAQQGRDDIKSSIQSLQTNYNTTYKRYKRLESTTIGTDVLKPKQTRYRLYTVNNINAIH